MISPGIRAHYVAFYDGENWQQINMGTTGIVYGVSFIQGNGVPNIPLIPNVISIGNTFFTLSFSAPSDNGCPISNYEFQKKLTSDPYFVFDGLVNTSTFIYNIINLQPDTSYDIKYCAYNNRGAGPWSPILTLKTTYDGEFSCNENRDCVKATSDFTVPAVLSALIIIALLSAAIIMYYKKRLFMARKKQILPEIQMPQMFETHHDKQGFITTTAMGVSTSLLSTSSSSLPSITQSNESSSNLLSRLSSISKKLLSVIQNKKISKIKIFFCT